MNPFKLLDVHRKSTDEEIRDAYMVFAKKYHTDNFRTGDAAKFLLYTEAYGLIKNKEVRKKFLEHPLNRECAVCSGTGVKAKSNGLTLKTYKACVTCGGAGINIKEENKDVTIELRGTDGPSRKGRNNKR